MEKSFNSGGIEIKGANPEEEKIIRIGKIENKIAYLEDEKPNGWRNDIKGFKEQLGEIESEAGEETGEQGDSTTEKEVKLEEKPTVIDLLVDKGKEKTPEIMKSTSKKEISPTLSESLVLDDLLKSPNISLEEVKAIIEGLEEAEKILREEKKDEETENKLEKIRTKLIEAKEIEETKQAEKKDTELVSENIEVLAVDKERKNIVDDLLDIDPKYISLKDLGFWMEKLENAISAIEKIKGNLKEGEKLKRDLNETLEWANDRLKKANEIRSRIVEKQLVKGAVSANIIKNIVDEKTQKARIETEEATPEISEEEKLMADEVDRAIGQLEEFKDVKIDEENKEKAREVIENYLAIKEKIFQKEEEELEKIERGSEEKVDYDFYVKLRKKTQGQHEELERVISEIEKIESELAEPAKPTEKTPKSEPKVERGKISRSLRESLEGIEDTIDVLSGRFNKESKKLEVEGLSREERNEIKEERKEILEELALSGLGRETIRTSIAIEGSLSPREEREAVENITIEHRMDLKLYEKMRDALNKSEESFDEKLESKPLEVQGVVEKTTKTFSKGIKEKVGKLFGGLTKERRMVNKTLKEIENAETTEKLSETIEKLIEKAEQEKSLKKETLVFLKRIKNRNLNHSPESVGRKLSSDEMRKELNSEENKGISDRWRGIFGELLTRIEEVDVDAEKTEGASEEIDKWIDESELTEKVGSIGELKDSESLEGLGSVCSLLRDELGKRSGKMPKEIRTIFNKVIKPEDKGFGLAWYVDSLKDKDSDSKETDFEDAFEKDEEMIGKLDENSAFGIFMAQLLEKIKDLKEERFGEVKEMRDEGGVEGDKINPEIEKAEKKVVEFIESITNDIEQVKNACDEFKKIKKNDDESFGSFVGRISNPYIKGYLEKNDKISEIKEMKVKEVFSAIEKYIKGKEK